MVARRRQRREYRQFRQRNVHAERARTRLPPLHPLGHRRWDHFAGEEFLEKLLRINVGNDGACPEWCAIFQYDSGRVAALHDDFANRRAHIDANAVLAGCPRHRLRYRAHASDGMPPDASFAVHLTESVMQEHIAGPGRVRTRHVAHDRVEPEHSFDGIGIEPMVENVARRFAKQFDGRLEPVDLHNLLAIAASLPNSRTAWGKLSAPDWAVG